MMVIDRELADEVVSVIIPCWNSEKYVSEAIESVLGQSFKRIDLIVVNDGSTDASESIINSFGSRLRLISIENSGACVARNVGLTVASGKWVKFLDSDDLLEPDVLQKEVECLRGHQFSEDVLVASASLSFFQNQSNRFVHWSGESFGQCGDLRSVNSVLLFNSPPVGSPLYSLRMLREIGGFNESLTNREDEDLFFRYMALGVRPKFSGVFGYLYRQHNSESRVSLSSRLRHTVSELNMLKLHAAVAMGVKEAELSQALLTATSWRAWSYGRSLVRNNLTKEAMPYFEFSKSLGIVNPVVGSDFYHFANRFIGPIGTEKLFGFLKMLR